METVLRKRSKRQCVNRRIDAGLRGDEPLDRGYLAQEKTRACANHWPEIHKRRSPWIAPEPFDNQPKEQADNQAVELNLRVTRGGRHDHRYDLTGGF